MLIFRPGDIFNRMRAPREPPPAARQTQVAELPDLYLLMAEYSMVGIVITDLGGKILTANPAALAKMGIEVIPEGSNLSVFDFVAPESQEAARFAFGNISENRKSSVHTFGARNAQGKTLYVDVLGNRITWNGGPANIISIRDITTRRNAEEALRNSEMYLKTIFDNVQTGLLIIDPESHTIVDANPAAVSMIGRERDTIIGASCHRFICPAEKGKCPVTDLGQSMDNAERILLSATGKRTIIKTVVPAQISRKTYLLESFIDITGRKKAEEACAVSEEKYRMLAAASPDIISRCTPELVLAYVSPAVETILGYDPADLAGKNILAFVHPEDREKIRDAAREIGDGSTTARLVLRLKDADGQFRWFESISHAVRDETLGRVREIYNISRDITLRQAAEEIAHRRDRVLHGFAAASGFLLTGRLRDPVPRVLATIGEAMSADAAYIYEEDLTGPEGRHESVRRYCWGGWETENGGGRCSAGITGHHFPTEWSHRLASGVWISGCMSRFPEPDREIIGSLGIRSILLVPIFVMGSYWGFIGVSDLNSDRTWADSEIEILMTLAATLGLVIGTRTFSGEDGGEEEISRTE